MSFLGGGGFFGSGGKSNSGNSTTENTTVAHTIDLADSYNSSADVTTLGDIKDSNVILTDNSAIKSAFDFATEQSANSVELARDLSSTSRQAITEAIESVTESARTETENIFINLQKLALYGGLIAGVVFTLRALKR